MQCRKRSDRCGFGSCFKEAGKVIIDYMESKENLMEFLAAYVREHPQVDINIIIPKEENIRSVLDKS